MIIMCLSSSARATPEKDARLVRTAERMSRLPTAVAVPANTSILL